MPWSKTHQTLSPQYTTDDNITMETPTANDKHHRILTTTFNNINDNMTIPPRKHRSSDNEQDTNFFAHIDDTMQQIVREIDLNTGKKTTEHHMQLCPISSDDLYTNTITYGDYLTVFEHVKYEWRQYTSTSKQQRLNDIYVIYPDINSPLKKTCKTTPLITSTQQPHVSNSILTTMVEMMVQTAVKQLKIQYGLTFVLPIQYNEDIDNKDTSSSEHTDDDTTRAFTILTSNWWRDFILQFEHKLHEKRVNRDLYSYCFRKWITYADVKDGDKWIKLLQADTAIQIYPI